ncbi:GLPGLI family protein [Chryseobacterium sp.]|uniref:GLPGLI family protein n=1 Tax=Chryseobacterium sp. TaxID=1871047 RepID=UPI00289F49D5|nr:GLPGLI family protein [Chryseobacterium sp.]
MKKLILLFHFLSISIFAQSFEMPSNFRMLSSPYSADSLGLSDINIFFKVSYIKDINNPSLTSSTHALLAINSKYSKFTDLILVKRDSLENLFSKQNSIGAKEFNEYSRYHTVFGKNVLKNFSNRTISIQERFRDVYQYEENIPKMNWKLIEGSENVLGYSCNKATLSYKGREYNAWYTTSIPIYDGPFIFGNLPGLILKIEDKNKEYSFEAVAITKKPTEIYWRKEKSIKNISRNDFFRLEKTYHDNPGFFVKSKALTADGQEIIPKVPARPFNPIEKE